jgi:hypothetical protein
MLFKDSFLIDVLFFKYFCQKNGTKMGVFDSKQSQIMQNMIVTLVFEKNAKFFCWQIVENRRKL